MHYQELRRPIDVEATSLDQLNRMKQAAALEIASFGKKVADARQSLASQLEHNERTLAGGRKELEDLRNLVVQTRKERDRMDERALEARKVLDRLAIEEKQLRNKIEKEIPGLRSRAEREIEEARANVQKWVEEQRAEIQERLEKASQDIQKIQIDSSEIVVRKQDALEEIEAKCKVEIQQKERIVAKLKRDAVTLRAQRDNLEVEVHRLKEERAGLLQRLERYEALGSEVHNLFDALENTEQELANRTRVRRFVGGQVSRIRSLGKRRQ